MEKLIATALGWQSAKTQSKSKDELFDSFFSFEMNSVFNLDVILCVCLIGARGIRHHLMCLQRYREVMPKTSMFIRLVRWSVRYYDGPVHVPD